MGGLLETQEEMAQLIRDALETNSSRHQAVILQAFRGESIRAHERTMDRLLDEGVLITFAATDTTSPVSTVTIFHLLNNRRLHMKLREELDALSANPNDPWTVSELERLPYLVRSPRR